MSNTDNTDALHAQVQQSVHSGKPVNIVGGNSKHFLGRQTPATEIHTTEHTGIVNYEPTELVVTVRSGTLLVELNEVLAASGQMLPFEPPVFSGGTIGGVLATGLSGPRRPFAGSARDYVLGMRIINGKGEALHFGGEVMKNVAGYDASRLQVGAYGTLGLILDASMKVLPKPESEITLVHSLDDAFDTTGLVAMMRTSAPLSAAAIVGNEQYIRLGGSARAVSAAQQQLGGQSLSDADEFWTGIRDLSHSFFTDKRPLWRVSVPEFARPIDLDGNWLYDWAGAQRWLKTDEPAERIYAQASNAFGHASCYSSDRVDADVALFQPMSGVMQGLQSRLRDSFDQHRLFNPGRFHTELDTTLD